MPLQYIIDGYNIINHITFPPIRKKINPAPARRGGIKDPRRALLDFIKYQKFGRKPKSKITVVFDGYPNLSAHELKEADINVIFSKEETADAWIKRVAEASKNPRDITVVSDDRQIQFFVKSVGAKAIGVEEFIHPAEKLQRKKEDLIKSELNYSQISKINQELKALWLKD